ncbi:MAG: FAD binding domain-containing protein [Alphaproteobacteria bacterium]
MKSAKFDYDRAGTLGDALATLGNADGEFRVLGGGQSLGPMMNLRLAQPDRLIDLSKVAGLDGIDAAGATLRIGARVTHARIEDGGVPGETGAYMKFVATGISYRSVRNRGTIGGSLAHADPAADWPSALLALGGEVVIAFQDGERKTPFDGFQIGPFATGLGYDEILVAVELPQLADGAKWGYYKVNRKPGEFADAIGAVVMGDAPRAVCGATGSAPFRVDAIEQKLAGGSTELSIAEARDMISGHDPGFDDYELQIHAVALSRAVGRAFA